MVNNPLNAKRFDKMNFKSFNVHWVKITLFNFERRIVIGNNDHKAKQLTH